MAEVGIKRVSLTASCGAFITTSSREDVNENYEKP